MVPYQQRSLDPAALLLEYHLKALKLPTILRDYASVAAACTQERDGYAQYLLRLTERELLDRERRAMVTASEGGAVPDDQDDRKLRLCGTALAERGLGS